MRLEALVKNNAPTAQQKAVAVAASAPSEGSAMAENMGGEPASRAAADGAKHGMPARYVKD
ncbi:MAG: hypothetical protein BroJett014_15350 [Planctomycetota bacterium]|nr:MAG: hypothetical protein BroJett014_15350 [Planctomycetota bacterium]